MSILSIQSIGSKVKMTFKHNEINAIPQVPRVGRKAFFSRIAPWKNILGFKASIIQHNH